MLGLLSRRSYLKQFPNICRNKNKTFLKITLERICALKNLEKLIFICNQGERYFTAEMIREINIGLFGRRTASAITIGT